MTAVVRVGIGCFVRDAKHAGAILIGERKGSHGAGKLALPGGHLELGESWETCAAREVKEETNLDLDNFRFVHVTNDPSIGGDINKHYITIFMSGAVSETSDELQNLEPHKCVGWRWITWEELETVFRTTPELLFDPLLHLIESALQNPSIIHNIFNIY